MISRVFLLFGICIILSLVFFGLFLGKVKEAAKKKWLVLLYLLIVGILIGAISQLGFYNFTQLPVFFLILAQLWLLIVGALHVWFFEKFFRFEMDYLSKILITLAVLLFGYGLVTLVFKLYFNATFPRVYFLPALFFLAPAFVLMAFDFFTRIPVKVFKVWDFPTPGSIPDPKDSEMANVIIMNFEIRRKTEDADRTVFKAKAPRTMTLGKLYYFFISDYNSRNPNQPILITDNDKKLYKWSFYRSVGILIGKVHLDADKTVLENRIKENTTIICERINP